MIVRFKSNLLVVTAESEEERESLVCWSGDLDGDAFILKLQDPQTFCLLSAGPEAEVRREPITRRRSVVPDGKRRRRHSKNQSRRRYYAKHRAIRFANRFWNPSDGTKEEAESEPNQEILVEENMQSVHPVDQ